MLTHRCSFGPQGRRVVRLGLGLPVVPGPSRESGILERSADGEVVQALKGPPLQPERLVHRIVVEASDPRRTRTHDLRFEIQRLPDDAGLPEEVP